jgi:hypothetical protein
MIGVASSARAARLRVLHQTTRRLGIDDETYRARLVREFGVRSASLLTDAQLDRAIDMFHVKQKVTLQPHAKLVRALWIALSNLGAVDRTDAALDHFVERQTGKQKLQFLTAGESNSVTEALKAMCAREGFEVQGDPRDDRMALIRAQWRKMSITPRSTVHGDMMLSSGRDLSLTDYVSRKYRLAHGAGLSRLSIEQLDDCARAFGTRLRNALALQAAAAAKRASAA